MHITENEFKNRKLCLGHHIFPGGGFLGTRARSKAQIPGLDATGLTVWTRVGMNGDKDVCPLLIRHSGSLRQWDKDILVPCEEHAILRHLLPY